MTIPVYQLFLAMLGGAFCALAGIVFACLWLSAHRPPPRREAFPDERFWKEAT